ncbi:UNVERIFIED_CONTAM: hypothetical protein RMT77_003869 [Armadillidium vulgare]
MKLWLIFVFVVLSIHAGKCYIDNNEAIYYDGYVSTKHCTPKYCALLSPKQWLKCCTLTNTCCVYVKFFYKKYGYFDF